MNSSAKIQLNFRTCVRKKIVYAFFTAKIVFFYKSVFFEKLSSIYIQQLADISCSKL